MLAGGLVSVNKWVLIAKAGRKNVLVTKYEILHNLKLYTVGNRQDREFLVPRKHYGWGNRELKKGIHLQETNSV